MHALQLVIKLIEALVFGVSGGIKLRDPAQGRAAVRTAGVPGPLVPVIAWALPATEIGLAIGLAFGPLRLAALGALALTGLFDLTLAGRALRGDLGLCHCFGRWSGRISEWTIVRNLLLTGGAALLLWSATH